MDVVNGTPASRVGLPCPLSKDESLCDLREEVLKRVFDNDGAREPLSTTSDLRQTSV